MKDTYYLELRKTVILCLQDSSKEKLGWSGSAKVLGKLLVPGRPTNLDYSRAGAYCANSRCWWGLFGHFSSHLSLLFFFHPLSGRRPDID